MSRLSIDTLTNFLDINTVLNLGAKAYDLLLKKADTLTDADFELLLKNAYKAKKSCDRNPAKINAINQLLHKTLDHAERLNRLNLEALMIKIHLLGDTKKIDSLLTIYDQNKRNKDTNKIQNILTNELIKLIHLFGKAKNFNAIEEIVAKLQSRQKVIDIKIFEAIIYSYAQAGMLQKASDYFEMIPSSQRSTIAYNNLLLAHKNELNNPNKEVKTDPLNTIEKMRKIFTNAKANNKVNADTYAIMISAIDSIEDGAKLMSYLLPALSIRQKSPALYAELIEKCTKQHNYYRALSIYSEAINNKSTNTEVFKAMILAASSKNDLSKIRKVMQDVAKHNALNKEIEATYENALTSITQLSSSPTSIILSNHGVFYRSTLSLAFTKNIQEATGSYWRVQKQDFTDEKHLTSI